jgi:hypothetical protein
MERCPKPLALWQHSSVRSSTRIRSSLTLFPLSFSDTGGAQASYTFTGEAVAIYGTVSSDHGVMEVSIDGRKQDVTASSEGARVLHAQVRG